MPPMIGSIFYLGGFFSPGRLIPADAPSRFRKIEPPSVAQPFWLREALEGRFQLLEKVLARELKSLWPLAAVGDIRQEGLVAGVELVDDWEQRRQVRREISFADKDLFA